MTYRAFTTALILTAFVGHPAYAEMVSATKPPSKTAEVSKPKHDGKARVEKKHPSAEKKSSHAAKTKGDKGKASARRSASKTAHASAKGQKKKERGGAKPKHARDVNKDGRVDRRVASRDRQKERHGAH